jgi:hypothetical protein
MAIETFPTKDFQQLMYSIIMWDLTDIMLVEE